MYAQRVRLTKDEWSRQPEKVKSPNRYIDGNGYFLYVGARSPILGVRIGLKRAYAPQSTLWTTMIDLMIVKGMSKEWRDAAIKRTEYRPRTTVDYTPELTKMRKLIMNVIQRKNEVDEVDGMRRFDVYQFRVMGAADGVNYLCIAGMDVDEAGNFTYGKVDGKLREITIGIAKAVIEGFDKTRLTGVGPDAMEMNQPFRKYGMFLISDVTTCHVPIVPASTDIITAADQVRDVSKNCMPAITMMGQEAKVQCQCKKGFYSSRFSGAVIPTGSLRIMKDQNGHLLEKPLIITSQMVPEPSLNDVAMFTPWAKLSDGMILEESNHGTKLRHAHSYYAIGNVESYNLTDGFRNELDTIHDDDEN